MTTDDKIRDEKRQYDINKEAAKILALSSGKIDKYEYLAGNISKLAYSLLGKAFEKQTEKQVGAIKSLKYSKKKDELKQIDGIFAQNLMNDLISDKLKEIVNLQDIIKKYNLRYKSKSKKVYNFNEFSFPIVF